MIHSVKSLFKVNEYSSTMFFYCQRQSIWILLIPIFECNKLFYENQYGFRSYHSTEYATLELIDRIISKMDKDEMPFSVFLDLSKAFDTIDHKITT